MTENSLQELIDGLRCLPGVGPKSAQRMALHLLQRDREAGARLGRTLQQAMQSVVHCEQCRNFTQSPVCPICSSPERDASQLCVVESPADVMALEKATAFRGRYFVLMGNLSPLDGIGPDELGLDILRRHDVRVLQIARGIPMGGELEFADGSTLSVAFSERSEI